MSAVYAEMAVLLTPGNLQCAVCLPSKRDHIFLRLHFIVLAS